MGRLSARETTVNASSGANSDRLSTYAPGPEYFLLSRPGLYQRRVSALTGAASWARPWDWLYADTIEVTYPATRAAVFESDPSASSCTGAPPRRNRSRSK